MPDETERPFPTDRFDDLLRANAEAAAVGPSLPPTGAPARGLAIVTCMDARIDPSALLGLAPGDAVVLRNPGARITDGTLTALIVATHALGVERVLVLPHTDCRMARSTEAELTALLAERTGLDTEGMVLGAIADQRATLAADLERLRTSPYVAGRLDVAGAMLDVSTGRLDPVDA